LDEGIGDTFVSVGATIWLQTAVSINSAPRQSLAQYTAILLFEESRQLRVSKTS